MRLMLMMVACPAGWGKWGAADAHDAGLSAGYGKWGAADAHDAHDAGELG